MSTDSNTNLTSVFLNMLIHEHIRIAAVWFGAWTESKARLEAECTTTGMGDQTARDQADNFAQLRRLAHHRYQVWKTQQRAQRPESVAKVTIHGSIESPASSEPEGFDNGSVAQERLAVIGPEAFHFSEQQEIFSTPVGDVRPPQDTEEHRHESLSTQSTLR